MMRIGAQVPMAGGLLAALDYAVTAGCETMQVFAKSPRRWAGPALDPRVADDFRAAAGAAGVGPVFTHASYLINMGAEAEELWERSTAALADELRRAARIGASGLVIHLGRRFSDDDAESVDRLTRCVAAAVALSGDERVPILLENSAGAGRQFGVSVEEMATALVSVRAAGVEAALCFDTCHGFAGGLDVRTAHGWDRILSDLRAIAGPGTIRLIHANDCRGELGSHSDRHEWIGDGHIGSAGFAAMFSQPELADASIVVEAHGEGPHKDVENIRRLRTLRDGGAGSGVPVPAPA